MVKVGESGVKPGSRVQTGYPHLAVCAAITRITDELRSNFEKEAKAIPRTQQTDLFSAYGERKIVYFSFGFFKNSSWVLLRPWFS